MSCPNEIELQHKLSKMKKNLIEREVMPAIPESVARVPAEASLSHAEPTSKLRRVNILLLAATKLLFEKVKRTKPRKRRMQSRKGFLALNTLGLPILRQRVSSFRSEIRERPERYQLRLYAKIGNPVGSGERMESSLGRPTVASTYSATCWAVSKYFSYAQSSSYSQLSVEYSRQISGRVM